MRKFLAVGMAIVGLALLPQSSEAGVITGTLDIDGSVRITADGTIDWAADGGTTGVVSVANTSTLRNGAGPIINSGTATEKDLNILAQPTSGFAPLDLFETVSLDPTINFVLTDILSCAEIGGTCAAGADSPFSFAQSAFSVTVTLVMEGYVFSTLTPELVSLWGGTFTAQFPGTSIDPTTIAEVLAQLDNPGYIDTSFSASKITVQAPVVPEPATLLTFGIGSGLLALRRRRKAAAAANVA